MVQTFGYGEATFYSLVNALGVTVVLLFCAWRSWKDLPVSRESDLVWVGCGLIPCADKSISNFSTLSSSWSILMWAFSWLLSGCCWCCCCWWWGLLSSSSLEWPSPCHLSASLLLLPLLNIFERLKLPPDRPGILTLWLVATRDKPHARLRSLLLIVICAKEDDHSTETICLCTMLVRIM